jgi:hypothetical protein
MPKSVAFTFFIFIFSWAGAQVENGLSARFTFNDGTGKDELGFNYAILRGGMPAEDRFGNQDHAIFLQGNPDSYINLGTSSNLKPMSGSYSLWVKIDQAILKGTGIENNPILLTRFHDGPDFNEAVSINYHFNLRKLNTNTSSAKKQLYVYPVNTTYLRKWYHIVVTYDHDYLCFYLDGKLQGKVEKGFDTKFLEGDSVVIGTVQSTRNKRFFQGVIDDVSVYDRVLSPQEVLELFEAPNPNRKAVIARWILYAVLLLGLFFSLRLFIRRRIARAIRIEKEKNDLINRAYEQEIKTLKTQMNPHFIFNALNTIQQFIMVNENDKAQLYLSKFSRLIRKILESSTSDSINLEDEIRLLNGYIEIEAMRFSNVFEYKISISEQVANMEVHIPHFIIQPFVENAIWHGLLPKKGTKALHVTFDIIDEKTLACTVEDNGIGRTLSAGNRVLNKEQSLATEFVQQRLDLLSRNTGKRYGIFIIDKADEHGESEGTKVVINIPILN